MIRFVHISDLHLHHDPQFIEDGAKYPAYALVAALISDLQKLPFTPSFVLHTGDVVCEAAPEAYAAMRDFAASLPCPVYYTPGNLDDVHLMQTVLVSRKETSAELFYEVEVDGVQLVCLDSNCYTNTEGQYLGSINEGQFTWLGNICLSPDDRPLIVALHHPPLAVGISWLDQTMRLVNGDRLHQILLGARHRLRGVFHGHIHQPLEVVRDGIFYCCTSSAPYHFQASPTMQALDLDESAVPGYTIITLTPQQTLIRRYNVHMS